MSLHGSAGRGDDGGEPARIGVVIPCFESARFVREAVASVLNQTLEDWKLVVVDDGSTDDPAGALDDLLQNDARMRFVRQQNRGVASARNRGVAELGPTQYLLFLDADDILEPQMLAMLTSWLDEHPSAGVAHCRASFIDAGGRPMPDQRWAPRLTPSRWGVAIVDDDEPVTPFAAIFCLAGIVPSMSVIRRSTYDATPGWDESFGQHYEDTLLLLQLALLGDVHQVARPLVRHRRHSGQSTADSTRFESQERKLYDRFRDVSDLRPEHAAVVRDAWRFRERRVVPYLAVGGARRELRAGRPLKAARFVLGAARTVARSVISERHHASPSRRRRPP
jgi:glycosyltransferase involved in cell wall biosynthesis